VLAQNGAEALTELRHEIPRLIVTNWEMPEMDGAEFCRRVKCQPALAYLPIIMLSAMAEPGNGPNCWSAFFRKPVDLAVLMRTVDAFIAERLTTTSATSRFPDRPASRWQPIDPRCSP
jgi:CheY-like chemotaxis protein